MPYRLPELVEAISQEHVILIVEGEKDVDRLWSLGVPATCNAMGARKWKPEHSAWFEGADDVVVVGDNNGGQDHVQAVALALKPLAKRVRVLDLATIWPEIGPKGDISDWIDAGATADDLHAAIEQLPDWTQPQPGNGVDPEPPDRGAPAIGDESDLSTKPHFRSIKEFCAEFRPISYAVAGLMREGSLYTFTGRTGEGKTAFLVILALAVALELGERLIGRKVKKGRVAFCTAENPDDLRMRLMVACFVFNLDLDVIDRDIMI